MTTLSFISRSAFLLSCAQLVAFGLGTGAAGEFMALPRSRQQSVIVTIGSAHLEGVVVDAVAKSPILGARVRMEPLTSDPGTGSSRSAPRMTVTDANGRFVFPRAAAGDFVVSATHGDFIDASFGQHRPFGSARIVTLASGAHQSIVVPMWRGGTISGRVTSLDGVGLGAFQVRAFREVEGGKGIEQFAGGTDERGFYRIANLAPGTYFISAAMSKLAAEANRTVEAALDIERVISSAPLPSTLAFGVDHLITLPARTRGPIEGPYLPSYYLDSADISGATGVAIADGQLRTEVDIRFQKRLGATISGIVTNPDGLPTRAEVWLGPRASDSAAVPPRRVRSGQDGLFEFGGLPPGSYSVLATAVDSSGSWSRSDVDVQGASTQSVALRMQAGRTVSGTAHSEHGAAPTRLLTLVSVAADGYTVNGTVSSSGAFVLGPMPAGRYTMHSPDGPLRSALLQGRDILDSTLEVSGDRDLSGLVVTFESRPSELFGRLVDSTGYPSDDLSIVVASTDRRHWFRGSRRVSVARTTTTGQYSVTGLPAGDYMVTVVNDPDPNVFARGYLDRLSSNADRVTIPPSGSIMHTPSVKR